MTDKRLFLAMPALALLAACGGDAPTDDSRSASGEVLEGTISDAMLPVDRVRSEPPLEDPEAFATVRSKAKDSADAGAAEAGDDDATEAAESGADAAAEPAETPAPSD